MADAMAGNEHHEVVIIGAGVAGIYQIKRFADLGVDATVLDSGGDLGGTWYWNRYPGARFDSESYTYGYSFSKELLDEWCCFSQSVVESPRQLVAVFRSRISWDDGAIRERAGAVAFLMNRCCRSGEAVGARAPSVGKRWGSEASPWLVHTARRAALGPQDASTS